MGLLPLKGSLGRVIPDKEVSFTGNMVSYRDAPVDRRLSIVAKELESIERVVNIKMFYC